MNLDGMRSGLSFADFLAVLQDLEDAGEIEVEKWPANQLDTFKLRLTRDEEGRPLPRRVDA